MIQLDIDEEGGWEALGLLNFDKVVRIGREEIVSFHVLFSSPKRRVCERIDKNSTARRGLF